MYVWPDLNTRNSAARPLVECFELRRVNFNQSINQSGIAYVAELLQG